ncbi:MAG: rubredoxin-like domain-containing protein [Nanoarchaeota archaeon]
MVESKKFWRCTVCGDIHYGVHPPQQCPTCDAIDSYVPITKEEAKKLLGF